MREPSFSQRGQLRLANASPLMNMLCCVFASQYTLEHPQGPVNMGVAENSLMHQDLLEFASKGVKLVQSDLTYGTAMKGSERLFKAFISLYTSRFHPYKPIQKENLVTGSGMDQLTAMVCDEGDGVLLAVPYYAGFVKDIGCRNRCVVIPVDVSEHPPGSASALEAFEAKLQEPGIPRPKAIILCNPHNPLGYCHTRETIIAYCKFAEKHDLHLIVDEIYALSTFETNEEGEGPPFISVLSIDVEKEAGCHPDRVHHLYGASKDFCLNGLRIGCLHSYNTQLLESFTAPALFIKVGSPSDALFSSLVSDPEKLDWFVSTNQKRLGQAYAFATARLKKYGIPYTASRAGHFCLIDLRKWLPQQDYKTKQAIQSPKEQEAALFLQLLESGVYIAPGSFYNCKESGFFRLTFSVTQAIMAVGLDRLYAALQSSEVLACGSKLTSAELARMTASFNSQTLAQDIQEEGAVCIC